MYYVICYTYIQPIKQFKVQIIGILEEIDPWIDQKRTSSKCDKKIGQGPRPPSFGKNPKSLYEVLGISLKGLPSLLIFWRATLGRHLLLIETKHSILKSNGFGTCITSII